MTNRIVATLAVLPLIAFSFCRPAEAEVRLPGFFSDHMVVQQQMPIRVWGWADPGESVSVEFGNDSGNAVADANGKWSVELPAAEASVTAKSITVRGSNQIAVNDVLVGEVWLCSGQSNMEWPVRSVSNAQAEIAAANFPLIRQMKTSRRPASDAIDDLDAAWQICSPETVGGFTACGYFMARKLHQEMNVPIGLINSSWGGTRVEPWTPPVGFSKVEALSDTYQSILNRTPGTEAYQSQLQTHLASVRQWLEEAEKLAANEERVRPGPTFPSALVPYTSHGDPTTLYNGMIHALVGYPMRGAIWYQGEANHREGMLYFEKKKALIGGWRELWGQGDFPFYFVQIAPYQYGDEDSTILPRFWEAQAAVEQLPNTGMVVVNDIATINDIHPPNKQDVGNRLALLALKNDYGRDDVVARSPEMESFDVGDNAITIRFRNTAGGLKTRDGEPPTHFEVIGEDTYGFRPAKAEIRGDNVVLTSDEVDQPVAFRFAWHKTAEPNLCGATGLPVGAFRGGKAPDVVSLKAIESEYELVYDLDLMKLDREIKYQVDRSGQTGSFDRVGYFVELQPAGGETQKLFVSFDAFTDQATQIGIPVASLGTRFQQSVSSMDVFSNVDGIVSGRAMATGNIEFWPNKYGPANTANIQGASSQHYDFGDQPAPPLDGYGSMQVHNHGTGQTLFSINHWSSGINADLGIGNSSAEQRDWTFAGNANTYETARLRVFVRPQK